MRLSIWTTTFSLLTFTIAAPVSVDVSTTQDRDLVERETPLNAFLTILLDDIPAISGTISAVVGILTDFESILAALTGEQITYDELTSKPCAPYTVLFARGTSEPGNVGILVGPPFFDALRSTVGSNNLVIQGVNGYSASVAGYVAGGDSAGSAQMAVQIQQAYKSCPKTKLVVSGYSQGGQIVHNAIGLLPAAVASWVSKVVIFGDPDNGQALPNVAASKVDVYCHAGDNICVNGDLILPAHLTYAVNSAAAAAFVAS